MRALTPRAAWLQERMEAAGSAALRDLPGPDLDRLREQVRSLRAFLNGAGSSSGAARDRVQEELDRYRATGRFRDTRAARLVCWGTTLSTRAQGPLIEDGERFAPMIDEVDGFRADRRPYRRCWRGLLDGYIRYDPDEAPATGRENWRLLREYLYDNLPGLERGGTSPEWLRTVDDHANILTADPCARYGADLLESSADVMEPLRRALSAGDSSWIGRRVFDAQIDAAVAFDDRRLRSVLPQLLVLVAEHKLLGDAALARILDRYMASASPDPDADLRDAAVERWGNPWLERNDTRWTYVRPETRRIVSSWLKLKLIEQFFGLLSEDGINDQRRIAFWKRYVDEIGDMHFALGETAYRDQRSDFKALRAAMQGRLLRLDGGGARNNAFIMRIGEYVFVEFGEKGNAMFAFDGRALPFDLSKTWIQGNKTALKHPSHAARIIHIDSAHERWERKIERRIAELSRRTYANRPTTPGPVHVAPAPARLATAAGSAGVPSFTGAAPAPARTPEQPARPPFASAAATTGDLAAFLLSNRIRSVDLRDKGGSLWASVPKTSPVAAELRCRGFTWSERRQAWYLKP